MSDVSIGGGSLWKAIATAMPWTRRAPPKAESTCHFGAGLYNSGPGMIQLWARASRRDPHPCLALNFKGDFVVTDRPKDIEHANDVAVHGVTVPAQEYFCVRIFRMRSRQYRRQLVVSDHILVEVRIAVRIYRDTNVIAFGLRLP